MYWAVVTGRKELTLESSQQACYKFAEAALIDTAVLKYTFHLRGLKGRRSLPQNYIRQRRLH